MAEHTSSSGTGFGAYIAGFVLIVLGAFTCIPVIVNLPDTWPIAVLAIAIIGIGVGLIHAAAKARKEPPTPR